MSLTDICQKIGIQGFLRGLSKFVDEWTAAYRPALYLCRGDKHHQFPGRNKKLTRGDKGSLITGKP